MFVPIPSLVDTLRDLARKAESDANPLRSRKFLWAADLLEAQTPEAGDEMLTAITQEGFALRLLQGADGEWSAELTKAGEATGLSVEPMASRFGVIRHGFAMMWSRVLAEASEGA